MADKKLGMGLSALLGEDISDSADGENAVKMVAIGYLKPGKFQPRSTFGEDELRGLADSIRTKGVLQPLLVRPLAERPGTYEIIAGERRWRAAQLAQIHEVPVIVKDFDDRETLEVALIENLQRQDLSPLEEADGYQRLMDEFSHTQEALATVLGKSRPHVANMLRLLNLPEAIKAMMDNGDLSAGHARSLIGCENAVKLAKQVIQKGLNVRQTEKLVKADAGGGQDSNTANMPAKAKPVKDADTRALEDNLSNALGLKVMIQDKNGQGQVVIHYETLEQLDGVLAKLS
ncbi:MAG: chromosome partitioning protein ParB [Rhodospirillaceae bacterium]|nr:MAG: chromosome partitioning protein ParB [Rhodospirillaceae bacterium]